MKTVFAMVFQLATTATEGKSEAATTLYTKACEVDCLPTVKAENSFTSEKIGREILMASGSGLRVRLGRLAISSVDSATVHGQVQQELS